ncbi:MAG: HAD family hydrolase [Erysipelotrichaceae bacterium]|nr:HAD family hydrolase [Erysipelotrichaceae bacterium]
MKSYDAYLFDLYGTLIDIHTDESSMAFWRKIREFFHMYDADYDPKELRDAYFKTVREQEEQKTENGHLIEIEIGDVFQKLFKRKGIVVNKHTIKDIAWQFRQNSTSHLRLYAGAMELLDALRSSRKQVYLLSNAQSLFTLPELKMTGLYDMFDDIVISSEVGYRKPDPFIFESLLKKHDLKTENCLMIGNDLQTDTQGAHAIGMDSFYIRSALSGSETKNRNIPEYMLDHMDLRLLLRKLL